MANIQIPVSTSSLGPVAGLFYYIYDGDLTSVNYSGDVISTYFKSSYTGDIQYITYAGSSLFSFDYDGAIFFTAEKNYDTITFRRWIIDLDTLSLREIKASSFPQDGYYSFDITGFSIKKFCRALTSPASSGLSYIFVSSLSNIKAGQEVIIGPSSSASSINGITFNEVDHITGSHVFLKYPLDNSFNTGNSVVFIDDLLVSSRKGISGSSGSMVYIMDSKDLYVKTFRSVREAGSISSTDFNNDKLYMCSKYCIFLIDPNTYKNTSTLFLYQQCDGTYMDVYTLLVLNSSLLYTLQKNLVTHSNFACSVESNNDYNVSENSFLRYLNLIAVSFGSYVSGDEVTVNVTASCQYAYPLYNIEITFDTSDAGGSFSSATAITDTNGKCSVVYTLGDNPEQTVTAYADSTFAWRSSDYIYGKSNINKIGSVVVDLAVSHYVEDSAEHKIDIIDWEFFAAGEIKLRDGFKNSKVEFDLLANATGEVPVENRDNEEAETNIIIDAGHSIASPVSICNTQSAFCGPPIEDNTTISTFNFISYFLPECYSIKNSRDVTIDFIIFPSTYPFDIPTFSFKIREYNEVINYDSGLLDVTNLGTKTLIPLGGGLYGIRFIYQHADVFKYSSCIHCYLQVYDTAPISNVFKFYCYFDIIPDYLPPEIISISPQCDSIGVPKDVDIYVVVSDDGIGVDTGVDSFVLLLDGIPVRGSVYTVPGGYSMAYHPVVNFNPGAAVTLTVRALDKNNNLLSKACKFYIEESGKPEIVPEDICSDIVDNRFTFYFDVFDTGSGVKFDKVKLFISNKYADYIMRPVLKRIS